MALSSKLGVCIGLLISLVVVTVQTNLTPQLAAESVRASNVSQRTACPRLVLGVHADLMYEGDPVLRARIIAADDSLLRVRIVRSSLLWDRIEPGEGRREWAIGDAVVEDLTAGVLSRFSSWWDRLRGQIMSPWPSRVTNCLCQQGGRSLPHG